ncbi:MAG: hypothetical protein WC175_03370 [Candidatus Dojkabacteria bacterium]
MTDDDLEWKIIRFFLIPPDSVKWELRWYDKDGRSKYHPHTGNMSMIETAPPEDLLLRLINIYEAMKNEAYIGARYMLKSLLEDFDMIKPQI